VALFIGEAKAGKKGVALVFLVRKHVGVGFLGQEWFGFGGTGVLSMFIEMSFGRGHGRWEIAAYGARSESRPGNEVVVFDSV
jgi:hypothetical protein